MLLALFVVAVLSSNVREMSADLPPEIEAEIEQQVKRQMKVLMVARQRKVSKGINKVKAKMAKIKAKIEENGKKKEDLKKQAEDYSTQIVQKTKELRKLRKTPKLYWRVKNEITQLRAKRTKASEKRTKMDKKTQQHKTLLRQHKARLSKLLAKEARWKKKMDIVRKKMLQKQTRIAKRTALHKAYDKKILELEEEAQVEPNRELRDKKMADIKYLKDRLTLLKRREKVYAKRQREEEQRRKDIAALRDTVRKYQREYADTKKDLKAQLKTPKRMAHKLKTKISALTNAIAKSQDEADILDLQQQRKGTEGQHDHFDDLVFDLERRLRVLKTEHTTKMKGVLERVYRLEINNSRIRISEHKLTRVEYEKNKEEIEAKIAEKKKLLKRMDVCVENRRKLNKLLAGYRKELRRTVRRIAHNAKQVRRHLTLIGQYEHKIRKLYKREYRLFKTTRQVLKTKLDELRADLYSAKQRKACGDDAVHSAQKRRVRRLEAKRRALVVRRKEIKGLLEETTLMIEKLREDRLANAKVRYHKAAAKKADLEAIVKRAQAKIKRIEIDVKAEARVHKKNELLRGAQKYHRRAEKAQDAIKEMLSDFEVAKQKYHMLVTRKTTRLIDRKEKLLGKSEQAVLALKSLAKQEAKINRKLRRGICAIKKCKVLYDRKNLRLESVHQQKTLFKLQRKIRAIDKELHEIGQNQSLRKFRKLFEKERTKTEALEARIKDHDRQLRRIRHKIAHLDKKMPYLAPKEKEQAMKVERRLEEMQRKVRAKRAGDNLVLITTTKRYMSTNKEYIIQLKRAIKQTRALLETTKKERVVVLKRSLYEVDPKKQRKAEMRLVAIDRVIDHAARHLASCRSRLKKSKRIQIVLADRVKPVAKCGKTVNTCTICKELGVVVKRSVQNHESDRVVLERLQKQCDKMLPNEQAPCYDVAIQLAETALHTFDPMRFQVHATCQKIEACAV